MSRTREEVLQNLLNRQRCTINELAKAVEINPISVRHHIGKLEAEGLVDSEEERHGVGRPRRVYFLTEKGVEQFPARTVRLTNRLLDQMKETMSPDEVDKLFIDVAATWSNSLSSEDLKNFSLDERLDLIENSLTEEGFSIRIERDTQEVRILENSCPYYHVGQQHNEVCAIDRALISNVLEVLPERTTCLLDGDSHCTYVIPMDAIQAAQIRQ